jgi:hypothetical protein
MMDPLKDKIAAAGVLEVLVSLLTRWSKDADVVQVRLTRLWVDLTWFVACSGQSGWKSVCKLCQCSHLPVTVEVRLVPVVCSTTARVSFQGYPSNVFDAVSVSTASLRSLRSKFSS